MSALAGSEKISKVFDRKPDTVMTEGEVIKEEFPRQLKTQKTILQKLTEAMVNGQRKWCVSFQLSQQNKTTRKQQNTDFFVSCFFENLSLVFFFRFFFEKS